jgi:hypothetical protein
MGIILIFNKVISLGVHRSYSFDDVIDHLGTGNTGSTRPTYSTGYSINGYD